MIVVRIGGKVSDMGWAEMLNSEGKYLAKSGAYMPDIEGICSGDYIDIAIDNETGRIIGWVPLKPEDLDDGEQD